MQNITKILLLLMLGWNTAFAGLYHGSSKNFEKVEPFYSRRFNSNKELVWEGKAIFASPDYRVALFYTYNKVPQYEAGINLVDYTQPDQPITFILIGGCSLEDALLKLYGPKEETSRSYGYIYCFELERGQWEEGLGRMERIIYEPTTPAHKERIHKRRMLEEYSTKGLIILSWRPG